jgi:hypothetical protein
VNSQLAPEKLDALLRQPLPRDDASLKRLHEMLRRQPEVKSARSWKADALKMWSVTLGTFFVIGAIMVATSNSTLAVIAERSRTIIPLMVAGGLACWSALAPRRRWSRIAAVAVAAAVAGWVVYSRSIEHSHAPTLPEWFCSVSHFGSALPPLVAALWWLRRMQPVFIRPLVAGISVGTTGAMLGEVGCAQGFFHVLLFHVSIWAVVAAVTLLISSRIKATSHVP